MNQSIDWAGRLLGAAAGIGTSFLWISAIWFPTDGLMLTGAYLLPVSVMLAIIALIAAISSWHGHAIVMFVSFIALFLPVGITLLDADHFLRYAGVLNIVLAIASALVWLGRRGEKRA